MDIKINLEKDWSDFVCTEIEAAGYTVNEQESIEDISYIFFNIKRRSVSSTPRTVHEAKQLSCPAAYQVGYDSLKDKFTKGEDVTPNLSKRLLNDNHEDMLLNDWGIHHFHLGTQVNNGFVERTGPVLFAIVRDTDAYCISILPHGGVFNPFVKKDLIRIIHNEWPETISAYHIPAAECLKHNVEDEQIKDLRESHIQTCIQLEEGVIYTSPGGGYAANGKSLTSLKYVRQCLKQIRDFENRIRSNLDWYIDKIREKSLIPGTPPCFKLVINEDGFFVIETHSDVSIKMVSHKY